MKNSIAVEQHQPTVVVQRKGEHPRTVAGSFEDADFQIPHGELGPLTQHLVHRTGAKDIIFRIDPAPFGDGQTYFFSVSVSHVLRCSLRGHNVEAKSFVPLARTSSMVRVRMGEKKMLQAG